MPSINDQEWNKVIRSCEFVLSFLNQSGTRLNGKTYGSDSLLLETSGKSRLHALIIEEHVNRFGHAPRFTMDEIITGYVGVRKGNYETLRDKKPIRPNIGQQLLFIDPAEERGVATVYSYWGWNARAERRLVKIGYTSQELRGYLKSKEIQHAPELIATRCGGKVEESKQHEIWRHNLEDGREWFRPTSAMFARFRSEWIVEPDFDSLCERILDEYEKSIGPSPVRER